MTSDTQQFAERGADIAGVIQQQLDRDDLPPGVREAFTTLRDWSIDLTARWVQAAMDAEQTDAVLYGGSPAVLVHALKQHLSPGQRTQLARMLATPDADEPR